MGLPDFAAELDFDKIARPGPALERTKTAKSEEHRVGQNVLLKIRSMWLSSGHCGSWKFLNPRKPLPLTLPAHAISIIIMEHASPHCCEGTTTKITVVCHQA